jgi:hypothetical protein
MPSHELFGRASILVLNVLQFNVVSRALLMRAFDRQSPVPQASDGALLPTHCQAKGKPIRRAKWSTNQMVLFACKLRSDNLDFC